MFLINNYSALQRDVVHDQDDEQEQEDAEEARAIAEGIDNQVSVFFRTHFVLLCLLCAQF